MDDSEKVLRRHMPFHAGEAPAMWAIGDVHGALLAFRALLRSAGICDSEDHWIAGPSSGVLLGDLLNRGEYGAGVVQLVRSLQSEAYDQGGSLITLIGNHEVVIYGVLIERQRTPYGEFASTWLMNGGRFLDLEILERDASVIDWLGGLPVMALVGDALCLHADTTAYLEMGQSIAEVNAYVNAILRSHDLERIAALFQQLCRRREFHDRATVDRLLTVFGGARIVHGHTPIFAHRPEITHGGRCINIDGGMWESDEHEDLGFIYPLLP